MAAENGMPENEDVRKKALLRLSIAGVVTAAALAGLWWLDQGGGREKPAPTQTTSPAPIVPATPPDTVPPPTEPTAPDTAGPAQPETPAEEKPVQAAPATPSEPPPPPKVNNGPKAPQAASQASQAGPATTRPVAPAPAQPVPPATRPSTTPTVPAGQGFVVQLGVFSNPDNAREMVEKLNKKGIRAHLEARVQLGPFLNRQEAEKAQAEMRNLGYSALVTTAYPANPTR